MKKTLNLIKQLEEYEIKAVHKGNLTREEMREKAETKGFSKTSGERAHRLIRAHENLDAFIAFYKDGVAHAMSATEAPEIDGNIADVTVKYPHGRPVRGLDDLLRDHDEDPGEWELESWEANEWPTTMGTSNGDVIYVNNFQAKARMTKKNVNQNMSVFNL